MNGRVVFSVVSELGAAAWKDAIADLIAASCIPDKETALKAVLEREHEGSTAIGNGVAVPHARLDGIENLEVVIGRSKEGIAMGSDMVHIFLLILIPREAATSHVDFLAEAVRRLSSPVNREKIMTASSEDMILEAFL